MVGSNNLVVDTNIILYAAVNNDSLALDILIDNGIFISDITEIELLGYHLISSEEVKILKEFIAQTSVTPVTNAIKNTAIHLRKKYALRTPDAIIAATAIELDFLLVTADIKLLKINEIKTIAFPVD